MRGQNHYFNRHHLSLFVGDQKGVIKMVGILIAAVVGFLIGVVVEFFVMRNNPKYFKIDDILKGKRDDVFQKLRGLKEKF